MHATPTGSVFPRRNYLPSVKSLVACWGKRPHLFPTATHGFSRRLPQAPAGCAQKPPLEPPGRAPAEHRDAPGAGRAGSGRQGPGSCTRSPDPQPRERVLGHPRRVASRGFRGSRASREALSRRWSREPSPSPSESPAPPPPSQPLPWNAEPPGPSPQTKCLLYELHVNCFPAVRPLARHPLSTGGRGTAEGHLLPTPLPLNRHLSPFCFPAGDPPEALAVPGCPRRARQGCGGSDGACSPQPHAHAGSGLPQRDRDLQL